MLVASVTNLLSCLLVRCQSGCLKREWGKNNFCASPSFRLCNMKRLQWSFNEWMKPHEKPTTCGCWQSGASCLLGWGLTISTLCLLLLRLRGALLTTLTFIPIKCCSANVVLHEVIATEVSLPIAAEFEGFQRSYENKRYSAATLNSPPHVSNDWVVYDYNSDW